MSPTRLANLAGLNSSTILNWLNGTVLPVHRSVLRVADVLNDSSLALLKASLYSWKVRNFIRNPDVQRKRTKDFKSIMEGVIHDAKVPEKFLPLLLEAWSEIDKKTITEKDGQLPHDDNKIIILPKPNVVVLPSWQNLVEKVADGVRDLFDLHWKEFEDLMSEILEASGWEITPMGYTKDDGVDIVAVKKVSPGIPIEMMVQCKRNRPSRKVNVTVVREVWSVKWEKGFHQAMIATTSSFTRGAKEKAAKWNLDIRDYNDILKWCKNMGSNVGL